MSDLIKRSDAISKTMKDTIYREDAIDAIKGNAYDNDDYIEINGYGAIEDIRALPSADTDISEYSDRLWKNAYERGKADRPQGKWIRTGRTNIYGGIEVQCSNCGDRVMVQHLEDEWYCRHCGADMGMKGVDDE